MSDDFQGTAVDRAAGCIVGAFIGDALGLGCHWYYDLAEMRKDYGPFITGYTRPKPGRYHEGLEPGDLSQTGIIMLILLRSLRDCGEYVQEDFCRRLDEELLPKLDGTPFHGPGGYTNHSFRQIWQARVRDKKPWGETGGNADTSECAERASLLAARYAADPFAAAHQATRCALLGQTDSLVVQQSAAFASVLAALIRGELFDSDISGKMMALVKSGKLPFVAPSSIAAPEKNPDRPSLGFASPDALLLPSWVIEAASDPGARIDPAWKVSVVYGMSCAINFVLPQAYYLVATFGNNFEGAVLHAINGGGQNMSRACLTGALSGALNGLSAIPPHFVDGLKQGAEIRELAIAVARSVRLA